MHLEKHFDVTTAPDDAARAVARDETLLTLFPEAEVEIVERKGNRRTLRTRYRALGQEGVATFHFHFEPSGEVRFEKVCDGRVWRKLAGCVSFEKGRRGTRVRIEAEGATRSLVPEFTIRAPMREQIERMAAALRDQLEGGGSEKKQKK